VREGLDQDIGRRHQPAELLATRVLAEIEDDAALVGVVEPEEQAAVGIGVLLKKGADPARRIAAGWLDLDHVGAQVGEQLAAIGAAFVGEVEDANAAQSTHRGQP
jgi:hypothetical protein